MKVKLKDGTELECSVEEFIEFQSKESEEYKKHLIVVKIKPTKVVEKLKNKSTIQETTEILDYIKVNPMNSMLDIQEALNIDAGHIQKIVRAFGGLKNIRKEMNLPLRRAPPREVTENRRKAMSFICKRGREIMDNEHLTRKEAFTKAAAEWKRKGGTLS